VRVKQLEDELATAMTAVTQVTKGSYWFHARVSCIIHVYSHADDSERGCAKAEADAAVARQQAKYTEQSAGVQRDKMQQLKQHVSELEAQLRSSTASANTVVQLESALASARAELQAAKQEATLATSVSEARQEAVWSLTKQVNELQQQLKYAVDEKEVETLKVELAAAKKQLVGSVSREEVEQIDAALADMAEEALNEADARVRQAQTAAAADIKLAQAAVRAHPTFSFSILKECVVQRQ
jgi:chromosome segregation ATPase